MHLIHKFEQNSNVLGKHTSTFCSYRACVCVYFHLCVRVFATCVSVRVYVLRLIRTILLFYSSCNLSAKSQFLLSSTTPYIHTHTTLFYFPFFKCKDFLQLEPSVTTKSMTFLCEFSLFLLDGLAFSCANVAAG